MLEIENKNVFHIHVPDMHRFHRFCSTEKLEEFKDEIDRRIKRRQSLGRWVNPNMYESFKFFCDAIEKRKNEDRESFSWAKRYHEIWTDLILSGIDKYEANIKAQEILEQEEMENDNI